MIILFLKKIEMIHTIYEKNRNDSFVFEKNINDYFENRRFSKKKQKQKRKQRLIF